MGETVEGGRLLKYKYVYSLMCLSSLLNPILCCSTTEYHLQFCMTAIIKTKQKYFKQFNLYF